LRSPSRVARIPMLAFPEKPVIEVLKRPSKMTLELVQRLEAKFGHRNDPPSSAPPWVLSLSGSFDPASKGEVW